MARREPHGRERIRSFEAARNMAVPAGPPGKKTETLGMHGRGRRRLQWELQEPFGVGRGPSCTSNRRRMQTEHDYVRLPGCNKSHAGLRIRITPVGPEAHDAKPVPNPVSSVENHTQSKLDCKKPPIEVHDRPSNAQDGRDHKPSTGPLRTRTYEDARYRRSRPSERNTNGACSRIAWSQEPSVFRPHCSHSWLGRCPPRPSRSPTTRGARCSDGRARTTSGRPPARRHPGRA